MSERTVTCPRCGQQVAVPTTGEKVRCPGCGQKFRFDPPPPPEGEQPPALDQGPDQQAEQPQESGPEADSIACPRCGRTVEVPKTGEKVRCPGCGQKFRYEVKTQRSTPEPEQPSGPPSLPPEPREGQELEPPPSEAEETDETEEAAAEEGEAQGLEEAKPEPVELLLGPRPGPASPSLASELRTLWPALGALLERVYQDGKASEGDRIRFREEARRAAELARLFLPVAEGQDEAAREFALNVLPRMSLEEVIALSLEDFRHLSETFQETAQLLEARLPGSPAPPEMPTLAAGPQPQPAAQVRPRPLISTTATVAVVVLFGLLVVLILNLPELKRRLDALNPPPPRTVTVVKDIPRAPAPATSAKPSIPPIAQTPGKPGPNKPQPPTHTDTEMPVFENQKPHPPATSTTPAPKPTTTRVTTVEKPVRVPSRWKPGPDGWITVFGGLRPDGLQLDPANWSVEKGLLVGRAPAGETGAAMREANWTDYTLEAELELDSKAEAWLAHGSLRAELGDKAVRLLHRGRVLDELAKGLRRGKWYRVVLDVAGPRVQVRINNQPALQTAGFDPSPGAPAVGARNGAVAFRNVRVKLHPTDPDYRAVALGEGYLRPPGTTPPTPAPSPQELGPGVYRLFNGRDLAGWRQSGQWRVVSGAALGSSPGMVPATLIAGSPKWSDYTLELRFRIVRQSAVPRENEYALVIFRARDGRNFHCVRFAVEGIYEIGYYRSGRFHETSRARFGLGSRSKFNHWHALSLTARGGKLTMSIDGVGGMPPWPITNFPNGALGIGVTGGQAAFRDITVKVLR